MSACIRVNGIYANYLSNYALPHVCYIHAQLIYRHQVRRYYCPPSGHSPSLGLTLKQKGGKDQNRQTLYESICCSWIALNAKGQSLNLLVQPNLLLVRVQAKESYLSVLRGFTAKIFFSHPFTQVEVFFHHEECLSGVDIQSTFINAPVFSLCEGRSNK